MLFHHMLVDILSILLTHELHSEPWARGIKMDRGPQGDTFTHSAGNRFLVNVIPGHS